MPPKGILRAFSFANRKDSGARGGGSNSRASSPAQPPQGSVGLQKSHDTIQPHPQQAFAAAIDPNLKATLEFQIKALATKAQGASNVVSAMQNAD
eukprot:5826895-Pyramimonas_sp.AAC.1